MRFNHHKLLSTFVFLLCCTVFQIQAQNCVTFTNLPSDSYAVTGGYPLGTPFHTESGLDVSLAPYYFPNGDVKNNVSVLAGQFFWSGLFIAANTTYIKMLKAGIQMDFTEVEPNKIAGTVTFDFLDWSGYVNLTINDSPVVVETTYSLMPSDIAPGVTMDVTDQNVGAGGKMGSVTLVGDISSIIIGAENFGVDNICFQLKDAPLPPCELSQLTVSQPTCTMDGTFAVEINLANENASGSFNVSGNGMNHGMYNYSDLPITIDGLSGDNVTNYEFLIEDAQFVDCSISTEIGTVFCELPCSYSNMTASASACDNGTFSAIIDFDHANSSGSFTISGNGNVYGTYNTSDLPLTFGTFTGDGTTVYEFVVTDSQSPNCTANTTLGTISCQQPCEINEVMVGVGGCDPNGQFLVTLDFAHANSSESFTVTGNGTNYGTFSSSQLPINIGPLDGDGTTSYEFTISDAQMDNCSAAVNIGTITCQQPCTFTDMVVTNSECDGTGEFFAAIDFNHENSSTTFSVNGNGTFYGNFNTADLPISIGPLEGDGTTVYEFSVADSQSPNCAASATLGTVNCESPCLIWNTVVNTNDCDNGEFFAIVNFDYESTSGIFEISGNGQSYGNFNVNDLPVTIGPFAGDGSTVYEFIIEDTQSQDCSDFFELGTVFCEIPVECAITNLSIFDMECTSDQTFRAQINFDYEDVGSAGFRMFYQGNQIGIFQYNELPLNLNNLNTSTNAVESITICDTNDATCCQTIEFESMDCSSAGCVINEVMLNRRACEDGFFMLDIDLNAQSGGLLGFQVLGNGTNYGTFSYADLPIPLGPFEGDGATQYEFLVIDMLDQSCTNFAQLETYNCLEECTISDVNFNVGSCNNDGETFVLIDFASDNTSSNYEVTVNGVDFGSHTYASGDVVIGPIAGDGITIYKFIIKDTEAGNCSGSFEVGPITCETTNSTNELSDNQVKVFTNQDTDQLFIQLLESANRGQVAIYNTVGQLLLNDQITNGQQEKQYDISVLQPGIYICQVELDGKLKSWKFSKH